MRAISASTASSPATADVSQRLRHGGRILRVAVMKRETDENTALHRIDAPARIKGRGAASNPEGRFESIAKTREDDGWHRD